MDSFISVVLNISIPISAHTCKCLMVQMFTGVTLLSLQLKLENRPTVTMVSVENYIHEQCRSLLAQSHTHQHLITTNLPVNLINRIWCTLCVCCILDYSSKHLLKCSLTVAASSSENFLFIAAICVFPPLGDTFLIPTDTSDSASATCVLWYLKEYRIVRYWVP